VSARLIIGEKHPSKAQARSRAEEQASTFRVGTAAEAADLVAFEFSEIGRDPRFLPGWWVIPSLLGTLTMVWTLVT